VATRQKRPATASPGRFQLSWNQTWEKAALRREVPGNPLYSARFVELHIFSAFESTMGRQTTPKRTVANILSSGTENSLIIYEHIITEDITYKNRILFPI
jgi:hypothetical protein